MQREELQFGMPFQESGSYSPFFYSAGLIPQPYATAGFNLVDDSYIPGVSLGGGYSSFYDYGSDSFYNNPYAYLSYQGQHFGGNFNAGINYTPGQDPQFYAAYSKQF